MKKPHLNINVVDAAYCPHCRALTNLSISITLRIITAPDGTMETLISRTYHCESCRSFVRSEDDVLFAVLSSCRIP